MENFFRIVCMGLCRLLGVGTVHDSSFVFSALSRHIVHFLSDAKVRLFILFSF